MVAVRPRRRYAEASRRKGELSIREAAQKLGIHPRTVRAHAIARVREEPSRLSAARRDPMGRLWVPVTAFFRFQGPELDDAGAKDEAPADALPEADGRERKG